MTELELIQEKLRDAGAVGFTCYITPEGWQISIKRNSGFDVRPKVSHELAEALTNAFRIEPLPDSRVIPVGHDDFDDDDIAALGLV
jgi:hypothetical protein